MSTKGWLLLLITVAVVAISACNLIPSDMRIETVSDLGPDVLSRIDEINRILATGAEIGPETRALIEQINETLRTGAKVGLDAATLERVDGLLRRIEDGFKLGLDAETLASVNNLINVVDNMPDKWENTVTQIINTLEGAAGSTAKTMANEVKGLMVEARTNMQQLIATSGVEFRCNVDFLGAKAGATVKEFIGRSLIGRLKSIITGKPMQTEIPQPWVCQIIPDLIELASQGSKVVPTKSVIGITGYNYVDKNVPALVVVDETGATIPSVVLYAYRKSPYELQINMQDADFKAVPARARLELRWPNVPDRCAIAIVLPAAPAPVAEFKGEPRDGKAPLSVVFTDLSTNNPTSWKWDFGDGETSTQQRPTHAYSRVGTFTVKLTATNAQGSNTAQKNAYVTVSAVAPPPTAQFTADRRNGTAPLQVTFRDQSTGSPTTWRWEFGDGTTSAAQNPIHTYANPGTYSVKLTASNAQGSDIEDKREFIVVTAAPRPSPVAKFSGTPLTGDVPRTVTFRDESENTPTSWKWEFGDGTTSTVRNPSHTYSVKGAYTVKLTATNASGSNTAQKSNYIVLTNPWRQTASIGPFGGPFGSWQTKEMCPSGQFVFGISLRVEGDQGWGDDTGLNGIRLSCGTAAYSTDISSHTGYWGGWSERAVCSTGLFVTGAQLRIEGSQGIGDDAGAVDAKFVCQNGSSITGSTHHGWGTWKEWQSCPVGSAICGIETRVEGKQDGGDDTGLNDARFYCCSLP